MLEGVHQATQRAALVLALVHLERQEQLLALVHLERRELVLGVARRHVLCLQFASSES